MWRYLLTTVALLGSTTISSAQFMPQRHGSGGFGGGTRPFIPTAPPANTVGPLPSPIPPPINPVPRGFAGGFTQPSRLRPGYAFPPYWGGNAGWSPYYGYGYPAPLYENSVEVNINSPVFVQPGQPEPRVELSGEIAAVLSLTFPAPAEIWVAGKKGPGEPNDEWTLTSPPIAVGNDYTFKVKARWKIGGKTFEYEKTVAVAAGNRSRSLVISGTEIK